MTSTRSWCVAIIHLTHRITIHAHLEGGSCCCPCSSPQPPSIPGRPDQQTVAETLTLAAHFALGSAMPPKDLVAYVSSVINDLGLKKARDTVIGDAMTKGVSGGERKRVSIGVELISNPSVLFLDEPTSGASVLFCCFRLRLTLRPMIRCCTHTHIPLLHTSRPPSLVLPMQASTPSRPSPSWPP
jgi:hypothetical protein